jgi:hypothetical protein
MGVFRYADKYAAPTEEQRERYMTGKIEEHHFGPERQIALIEYYDAIVPQRRYRQHSHPLHRVYG